MKSNTRNIQLLLLGSCLVAISIIISFFAKDQLDIEDLNKKVDKELTFALGDLKSKIFTIGQYAKDSTGNAPVFNGEEYLFVFKRGVMTYWSTIDFVPQYSNISGNYPIKFFEAREGDFVVLKRIFETKSGQIEVVGLLPIKRRYEVSNEYLKSGSQLKGLTNLQMDLFDAEEEIGYLYSYEEFPVMKYLILSGLVVKNKQLGWLSFVLFWLGIVVFIRFVFNIRFSENYKHGFKLNVLCFTTLFFGLRYLTNYYNFPKDLVDSVYFSPTLYASSFYNPSLGDLLINALFTLVLSLYFFGFYNFSGFFNWVVKAKKSIQWATSIALSCSTYWLLDGFYEGFDNIYIHSQISLDITKTINFSDGRVLASVILILIGAVFFLLSDVVFKLLYRLTNQDLKKFWVMVILGGVLYFLIHYHIDQRTLLIFGTILGYYALLTLTKIPLHLGKMANPSIFYILICVLALSFIGAMAIKDNELVRSVKQKNRFAQEHLLDNDVLGEYLLNRVKKDIEDDLFIKARLSNPFLSKDEIEERIIRTHLPEYFNKYDIHINVYNASGKMIYGDGKFTIVNSIPDEFDGVNYKTDYSNLFFIDSYGNEPTKRYIQVISIDNKRLHMGYVAIDMVLKKIIPENVLPKLLMDSRYVIPLSDEILSYTVIHHQQFERSHGEFNYEANFDLKELENPKLFSEGIIEDGYLHFAIKDGANKSFLITSKAYSWENVTTNFSSIFLQIFLVIVLLALLYALYFGISGKSMNYSARIQLYLNIAFFLPLIVLSISTISLLTTSFEEEVNMEYFKKANAISENINQKLDDYWSDRNETRLKVGLKELSRHTHADANLYKPDGKLVASSQPEIFSRGLLSGIINYNAFEALINRGQNKVVIKEKIGNENYFVTYLSIRSFETGNLTGVLGVPYFESEEAQGERAIEVFNYIINLFVIIFLVFLAISYFVSKWITFPLKFMADALNRTTFSGTNEPIMWESEDEIGLMVSEYNKMVSKLEESKVALARSEKESAWRQIAQQVAHEIKNPLTPMKLTLQHWQMNLKNEEKYAKLLQKPINTLLFQVENLNDIASSFSSFAKMPLPLNERFEITGVVKKACELHKQIENGEMTYEIEEIELYVVGDQSLLSRIVSNIIINAEQARQSGVPLQIKVKLKKVGNKVRIEVKDNGKGIPESLRGKIFIPNFSTKASGSGIGLAIAKHGVESANGNIWFDSEVGNGTTFYIELPCE